MERMERKKRGHERAAPRGPGHFFKEEKQEEHIGQVNIKIHQMVPARVEPEEFAIDHVRDPGERVPVGGMAFCKGPDDIFQREAGFYVRVIENVFIVVEIDEIVFLDRPVGTKRRRRQEQRDEYSGRNYIASVHYRRPNPQETMFMRV